MLSFDNCEVVGLCIRLGFDWLDFSLKDSFYNAETIQIQLRIFSFEALIRDRWYCVILFNCSLLELKK